MGRRLPAIFLAIAAMAAAGTRAVAVPPEPVHSDVFVGRTDGVNTYRIPSIVVCPSGVILVFCEARKESGRDAGPTNLVLKRSKDGGRTWLPMQILLRGEGAEAYMNPCGVVDRGTGEIVLVCHNIDVPAQGVSRQHLLLSSRDDGAIWSTAREIGPEMANYDRTFVAGPGVGIQTRSGRLVIPGYSRAAPRVVGSEKGLFSRVIYSDDHGRSWRMGRNVTVDTNESQVVELADGQLMLNMRQGVGQRCRGIAFSRDGGETWGEVKFDRALNESPCQASLIRYSGGETGGRSRILFSNPDLKGERSSDPPRVRMTIRMSYDEGRTWPVKKLVHAGPSAYSGLARLPDGDVGLVAECGDKRYTEQIRFHRLPLGWITDGKDKSP